MRLPAGCHVSALWVTCLLAVLAAPAAAQVSVTTIVLVRHAEKADASSDPVLAPAGAARARVLAHVLRDVPLDAVFSTPFIRTRETARPVAEHHGLTVTETPVTRSFVSDLAARVRRDHVGETVLVVGHSNTTPELARALGATNAPAIADPEYDHMFIVTLVGDDARLLHLRYGAATP